jgi:protein-tyrosine phosphatase
VIDLHSHLLPNVDDGARTLAESIDLARAAQADGVTAIAATPHVRADYRTSPTTMERGVVALREAFAEAGVGVDVLTGAEVDVDMLWEIDPMDLRRLTLAGGSYFLLETPYRGWPPGIMRAIVQLRGSGLTPLLAHPERNGEAQDKPSRVQEAVDAGALVQITSGSVIGRLGASARRGAEALLERGLVHVLASDSHGPHIRMGGLADAAAALGDPALARYLTVDVPAAIVSGGPLPTRP